MLLGDYLNVAELRSLIQSKYISVRYHPTLPLAILNYTNSCMFENFWPITVQRCRGLIIELAQFSRDIIPESTIIARPFHKFFGLNHANQFDSYEENLPNVIPTVTEKMDGWFGIMWHYKEHYGVASRGSFDSPGAIFATDKLAKLVKYGAVEEFPQGYTPIFEIIFKEGKIVVDYPFQGLVLLALVNNETGEELAYEEMKVIWEKIAAYSLDNRPWIRLVKSYPMVLEDCKVFDSRMQSLVRHVKHSKELPEGYQEKDWAPYAEADRNSDGSTKNLEGFVLSYCRPGTYPIKIKVKLEEYKRLHKLITGVTPQQIWSTLHDPMNDWLLGEVPDHFRKWAIKWRDELYAQFDGLYRQAVRASNDALILEMLTGPLEGSKNSRATAVALLKERYPEVDSIALALLDKQFYKANKAIWNKIRPIGRESETFYREGEGE